MWGDTLDVICSLVIPLWIITEPLVFICVILKGPNFSPFNLWYFPSLKIYV